MPADSASGEAYPGSSEGGGDERVVRTADIVDSAVGEHETQVPDGLQYSEKNGT